MTRSRCCVEGLHALCDLGKAAHAWQVAATPLSLCFLEFEEAQDDYKTSEDRLRAGDRGLCCLTSNIDAGLADSQLREAGKRRVDNEARCEGQGAARTARAAAIRIAWTTLPPSCACCCELAGAGHYGAAATAGRSERRKQRRRAWWQGRDAGAALHWA